MPDNPERLISDMRGVRYGEVLPVFAVDGGFEAHVYGTQMLNDCPQDLWEGIDADSVAREMGAIVVRKNGPRYWLLDGLGTKVEVIDPVFREFNGITMRRIAVVPLGDTPGTQPYVPLNVNRGAVFFFDAGKPVFELVDPDGLAYVMQARCVGVDPSVSEEALPGLADRLALPDGWTYRQRVLERELIVDTTDKLATVVQDELENTYTLPD
jgi:hypothetical protein